MEIQCVISSHRAGLQIFLNVQVRAPKRSKHFSFRRRYPLLSLGPVIERNIYRIGKDTHLYFCRTKGRQTYFGFLYSHS